MTKSIDSFTGDYRFLSNFYPCKVRYLGLVYQSVEHAFQGRKQQTARTAYGSSDAPPRRTPNVLAASSGCARTGRA